jgi:hypothetical protein
MKKVLLSFFMCFLVWPSDAQSWNPYVSQGIISPAPLQSAQLNGEGIISFNIGNTGSTPLNYFPETPENNLSLVISLSNGLPNASPLNPLSALTIIGGTSAKIFNWVYDMTLNTFTGKQILVIPGESQGSIVIQYKVSEDSPLTQPKNGFSAKCIAPPYTQATNNVNDDQVTSFTCTK